VPRLIVLRHAQSVANAAGLFQGWSDAPLSELGEAQAEKAGRTLAEAGVKPARVASSDLVRARRTAQVLAAATGYRDDIAVDPGLREQDLGAWNGLTREEVGALWPGELAARDGGDLVDVAGGEPARSFKKRCLDALMRVAAECKEGEEAVVVAHGGVLVALERAMGVWRDGLRHPNLSGWWVEASRGALSALGRVELLSAGVEIVSPSK
jgi:broad specificity phosphatase PhoE